MQAGRQAAYLSKDGFMVRVVPLFARSSSKINNATGRRRRRRRRRIVARFFSDLGRESLSVVHKEVFDRNFCRLGRELSHHRKHLVPFLLTPLINLFNLTNTECKK